jgi:FkbM family methyltransferase
MPAQKATASDKSNADTADKFASIDRNLIFDLGLHHGYDAEFYLNKGFKVIALEANPLMIERARANPVLRKAEEDGRLGIVPMALWHEGGQVISFYVNHAKDDWSSINKVWAEKGAHQSEEIAVATITLDELFEKIGVPYYVKCDLEGADSIFSQQLVRQGCLPAFASAETSDPVIQAHLVSSGYDRFQIVNQARHSQLVPPYPPREGKFANAAFNGEMSGLFGLELPKEKWIPYDEANECLTIFKMIAKKDFPLLNGWFDVHATTQEALNYFGNQP